MTSSICLRLKRCNQTYFITTDKSKSIQSLKEEVTKALNNEIKSDKIRVGLPDEDDDNAQSSGGKGYTLLADAALISDHERIQNESILYVLFRKKGMEDAAGADEFGELDTVWEDVNIMQQNNED